MLLLIRCYSSARVARKSLPVARCLPWLAVQPEGPSSVAQAPLPHRFGVWAGKQLRSFYFAFGTGSG